MYDTVKSFLGDRNDILQKTKFTDYYNWNTINKKSKYYQIYKKIIDEKSDYYKANNETLIRAIVNKNIEKNNVDLITINEDFEIANINNTENFSAHEFNVKNEIGEYRTKKEFISDIYEYISADPNKVYIFASNSIGSSINLDDTKLTIEEVFAEIYALLIDSGIYKNILIPVEVKQKLKHNAEFMNYILAKVKASKDIESDNEEQSKIKKSSSELCK